MNNDEQLLICTERMRPTHYKEILEITDMYGFLLCDPSECVGYVLLNRDDEIVGYTLITERGRNNYHIERLFVVPKYRKRGLGTYLVHLSELHAKDLGKPARVTLETVEHARPFWLRMGYKSLRRPFSETLLKIVQK
jgi:GNAT superfamily N-acetyltransferase